MRLALPIFILLAGLSPAKSHGSLWPWFNSELSAIEAENSSIVQAVSKLPAVPTPQILPSVGFHSAFAPRPNSVRWVQIDLGSEFSLDSVVVIPAFLATQRRAADIYGFPPRFRIEVSSDPEFFDSFPLLDRSDSDYLPLMAPIYLAANRTKARYIRFTATKLRSDSNQTPRFFFCLGEILAFSEGANVAARASVTASNIGDTPPTWTTRNLVDGSSAVGLPLLNTTRAAHGWRSGVAHSADTPKWVQVDLAASLPLQEVRLIPAHPPDFPERQAFGFPIRFKVEADDDENFSAPKLLFDNTGSDYANPGDNPVPIPARNTTARFVRITATKLWERSSDFVFALAEIEIYSGGANRARSQPLSSLDDAEKSVWNRAALTDGLASTGELMDWEQWLEQTSTRREFRERYHALETRKAEALALAQARAASLAMIGGGLIIVCAGATIWRWRENRARELRSLRERIARDLHDDLGSHLGSIRLMSELAIRRPIGDDHNETLEEIQRLSAEAAESMHTIVWLMRESGTPSLARLIDAIRLSADTLLPAIPHQITAPSIESTHAASLDFHRHVILIVRESLHNIARHAHAHNVRIAASWGQNQFELVIQDDGCGFEVAPIGNGLSNLRHRAASLGGQITIESAPSKGTRIHLQAPIQ